MLEFELYCISLIHSRESVWLLRNSRKMNDVLARILGWKLFPSICLNFYLKLLTCAGFWTRLSRTFWFDLSSNYWLILLVGFQMKIVCKDWIFRFYVERPGPGIWSRSWISVSKDLLHYSDLLSSMILGFRLWILNLLRMIKRSFLYCSLLPNSLD